MVPSPPTSEDESNTSSPTSEDESNTSSPTSEDESNTSSPTSEDESNPSSPTSEDKSNTFHLLTEKTDKSGIREDLSDETKWRRMVYSFLRIQKKILDSHHRLN